MSDKSLSKINASLFSYDTKGNDKILWELCDKCNKPFKFKVSDVKNRVINCPYCGNDIVYFAYKYD